MAIEIEDLAELTASALYAAAALEHNKRDEAPWSPYEEVAEQSKEPYRKRAKCLLELNLVILPVGRILAMEEALVKMDADLKAARKKRAPRVEVEVSS